VLVCCDSLCSSHFFTLIKILAFDAFMLLFEPQKGRLLCKKIHAASSPKLSVYVLLLFISFYFLILLPVCHAVRFDTAHIKQIL